MQASRSGGGPLIQLGEGLAPSPPSFIGPDARHKTDCMLWEITLSLQAAIRSY